MMFLLVNKHSFHKQSIKEGKKDLVKYKRMARLAFNLQTSTKHKNRAFRSTYTHIYTHKEHSFQQEKTVYPATK